MCYNFPRTHTLLAKTHDEGNVSIIINVTDSKAIVTMTKTLLHGKLSVT